MLRIENGERDSAVGADSMREFKVAGMEQCHQMQNYAPVGTDMGAVSKVTEVHELPRSLLWKLGLWLVCRISLGLSVLLERIISPFSLGLWGEWQKQKSEMKVQFASNPGFSLCYRLMLSVRYEYHLWLIYTNNHLKMPAFPKTNRWWYILLIHKESK